jgi:AraC-like DNA-binding protein
VAQLSGLSVSAFHRNFQAVTAMSPIQFQKHIRLQAARLLLANRPNDVTGVGNRVGYDSPSQFSREYRRLFGAPPSRDAVRIRAGGSPAAALPRGRIEKRIAQGRERTTPAPRLRRCKPEGIGTRHGFPPSHDE